MNYKIRQDTDPLSPSEYADVSLFIVANHRDFYVAEPGEKRVPVSASDLLKKYKKTHWIFPMEAYIHSGVVLALSGEGNFPDRRWDVSQLGYVFAAKSEWRLSAKAREAALAHIEDWNRYLLGDVWGYVIEDDDGTHVDSCWGYYDKKLCEEDAVQALASAENNAENKKLFSTGQLSLKL